MGTDRETLEGRHDIVRRKTRGTPYREPSRAEFLARTCGLPAEEDQAADWAAEQAHEDYVAFVLEGVLDVQERKRT